MMFSKGTAGALGRIFPRILSDQIGSRNFAQAAQRPTVDAFEYDIAVIGGGIVGLATARELLLRNPKLKIAVLEKENSVAAHQSSHNSGVIHAGVYYTPGSKRARLCVDGLKKMYKYTQENNIPSEKCGKVIVAVKESELGRLQALYERGTKNGVPDLRIIGPEEIRKIEPHLKGLKGILSPHTGITDYKKVTECLARDVSRAGSTVQLGFEVSEISKFGINKDSHPGVKITAANGKSVTSHRLITCAGVYEDRIAQLAGGKRDPVVVPFRGEWFVMKPQYRELVRTLIYPVPDPAFPWLGVHFTKKIDNQVWMGPNALLALSRQGYKTLDINLRDLAQALSYSGMLTLMKNYWRTGISEMYRSLVKSAYVKDLQEYIPEMKPEYLESYKESGVRALAMGPDGKLVEDFVFEQSETWPAVLHVRNAPSPGATASLAIAEEVANMAERKLDL